jgi:hypothetical protein
LTDKIEIDETLDLTRRIQETANALRRWNRDGDYATMNISMLADLFEAVAMLLRDRQRE